MTRTIPSEEDDRPIEIEVRYPEHIYEYTYIHRYIFTKYVPLVGVEGVFIYCMMNCYADFPDNHKDKPKSIEEWAEKCGIDEDRWIDIVNLLMRYELIKVLGYDDNDDPIFEIHLPSFEDHIKEITP